MTSSLPICMSCKHFNSEETGLICDAFPDGIPEQIILNQWDHTEPIEGDHGIQYEAVPDADPWLVPD